MISCAAQVFETARAPLRTKAGGKRKSKKSGVKPLFLLYHSLEYPKLFTRASMRRPSLHSGQSCMAQL